MSPTQSAPKKSLKDLAAYTFFQANPGIQQRVEMLSDRWLDEREYEDFADYETEMKRMLEGHDVKFVKAFKRPFGFAVKAEADPIALRIEVTASRVRFTPMKA